MSREIVALLLLLASPFAASAATVDAAGDVPASVLSGPDVEKSELGPLTWTVPCKFTHAGGQEFEGTVEEYHCDYILASLKDPVGQFTRLPTLKAQITFLQSTKWDAKAAKEKTKTATDALLKKTDPKSLDANLTPAHRLKALMALSDEVAKGVEICKPFLWPAREATSYLEKTHGFWPASWKPCMSPFYDRWDELSGLIKPLEKTVVDYSSLAAAARLRAAERRTTTAAPGFVPGGKGAARQLDKLYDGGETAKEPDEFAEPTPLTPRVDNIVLTEPRKISDLKSLPPPIPEEGEARSRRNYFARGYAEAITRLTDDRRIAYWHATGQTTTVGDPEGRSGLTIRQLGPTCGVASQYQAMKARGMDVTMADLAKEGLAKGYYAEYMERDGGLEGGTPSDQMNHLLTDHGVRSRYVTSTTPEALTQSIRVGGDALVSMQTKRLWNDPKLSDASGHTVYVTGAEVDATGKTRGFYINDTGTGEAKRFVPIDLFLRAWKGRNNTAVLFDDDNDQAK